MAYIENVEYVDVTNRSIKLNESLYNKLLKKFYNGEECNLTLQLLNR